MNDLSGSDLRHSIRAGHPEQQTLDQVILFQAADGQVSLDVRLEAHSVWLSQAQMAELFGRERSVISKHIGNVFKEGELAQESTCAKFAQVQTEGTRIIQRQVDFYNLDVIISVGYRVKSPRGTQFRIWATQVLRQHLIQGYSLHQRRLQERGLGELEQALALMARTLSSRGLVSDEGQAVLEVVQRYSRAWRWLLAYDEDRLPAITTAADGSPEALGLAEALRAIETLRADLARCGEATPLFGQNNRQALAAILGAIEQTCDGEPLYPTAQLRAAHLLYFVIKDHPFADGNKRIGTLPFLEFLRRNQLLLLPDGQPRIADNGMAALPAPAPREPHPHDPGLPRDRAEQPQPGTGDRAVRWPAGDRSVRPATSRRCAMRSPPTTPCPGWDPSNPQHLLEAHGLLMAGLIDAPARFRSGGVGIYRGDQLVHKAPPAARFPGLAAELLAWLAASTWHPLILSRWNPLLAWLPIEAVILRDLATEPTLSARRLAERHQLSQRALEKHPAALQQKGRLLHHGSPRAGTRQVL